ncbi:hypothetical protein N480_17960 [Pseudoalteromonas luteoviolacea S2607]|uniref:M1 family aminopeptidase n=1 Tax=Pseudoalteromonas luteoviolacea TaxID=43657 RepID=UPI0007B0B687|nr:M1 family aminopeptidase [Pseudoalteromonas luteoviolacea]KZN36362.1 hypothetical protein N480_17960 [Pseudoalteromonas luteoviolacea S2607]
MRWLLFIVIVFLSLDTSAKGQFDVLSYSAQLTPDIENQSLTGRVVIEFQFRRVKGNKLQFRLQAPDMQIKQIQGPLVKRFKVADGQIILDLDSLSGKQSGVTQVTIDYYTVPKKGLKFFDGYLYTLYNTANWLVSHDDIGDKAVFNLILNLPKGMTHVANGQKISSKPNGELIQHHWREDRPRPIYTFGFAAGNFTSHKIDVEGISYTILYQGFSQSEIERIFIDTKRAYQFFAKASNRGLKQDQYTFVVTKENTMQEVGSFSLVGERFMRDVLAEARENWLAPHELAHEWWGNSISAKSWNDFWLNEGIVQFMVAAFKEHAYGTQEYDREIVLFKEAMLRIERQGKTIPAVSPRQAITFEQFKSTYRKAAYSKGAYLFHMLRLELGEKAFWHGIRIYSELNWESIAATRDLKEAFEQSSGRKLDGFFERWVYSKQTTKLAIDVNISREHVMTLDVVQQGYQDHSLPLWVEVKVDGKSQLLKFHVTQNNQQFTYEFKAKPASIIIDPRQYFPISLHVTGLEEYLVENVEDSKQTLAKYWSMKRLVHSRYCSQEPALIQRYLTHFARQNRERVLQTAAKWWESKCVVDL